MNLPAPKPSCRRRPARGRIAVLLLAAFCFGGQSLQAIDWLGSSMSAKCLGTDCSRITFQLDVVGKVFVDHIQLTSNSSLWTFGSLLQVVDGLGNDVTEAFGGKVTEEGFEILTHSNPPWIYRADPLQITLEMKDFARRAELDGVVDYKAFGDLESNSKPYEAPFNAHGSATVAPEPETWFLLGTGLAVLGIVAWRRREDPLGEPPIPHRSKDGRA